VKFRSGTQIAGSCASDLRLKTAIVPFVPVLSKVVQLQPAHYRWRTQEFPEYQLSNALTSGLIAQEVEKVFPEMVSARATARRWGARMAANTPGTARRWGTKRVISK
jgi:hypothetical protein